MRQMYITRKNTSISILIINTSIPNLNYDITFWENKMVEKLKTIKYNLLLSIIKVKNVFFFLVEFVDQNTFSNRYMSIHIPIKNYIKLVFSNRFTFQIFF